MPDRSGRGGFFAARVVTPGEFQDWFGDLPSADEAARYGVRSRLHPSQVAFLIAEARYFAAIALQNGLPIDTPPEDLMLLQVDTRDKERRLVVELEYERARAWMNEVAGAS